MYDDLFDLEEIGSVVSFSQFLAAMVMVVEGWRLGALVTGRYAEIGDGIFALVLMGKVDYGPAV